MHDAPSLPLLFLLLTWATASESPSSPPFFVVFGDGTKSESEIFEIVRSACAHLELDARETQRRQQQRQPGLMLAQHEKEKENTDDADTLVLVLEPTRSALEGALALGYRDACGGSADAIVAVGPAGLNMAVAAAFLHGVIGSYFAKNFGDESPKIVCPADAIPPIFTTARQSNPADIGNWSLRVRIDGSAKYVEVPANSTIGRGVRRVTADDYLFGADKKSAKTKILRALSSDAIAEARVLSCLYDPRVQWMRDFVEANVASATPYSPSAFPMDRALLLARQILISAIPPGAAETFLRDAFCLPKLPEARDVPPGIIRGALKFVVGAASSVWSALGRFATGWNKLLTRCMAWLLATKLNADDVETNAVAISASVLSACIVLLASAACWWFLCPGKAFSARGDARRRKPRL